MNNEKNLSRLGVFMVLTVGMFGLAWAFGSGWNLSIASYFGLRKITYTESLGILQAVSIVTVIMAFTVKVFRDD